MTEQAPSDDELIAASVHDPEQFSPLFDRHAVDIHHYLARRIDSVADDLLSETFLVAFRQRDRYRAIGVGVRAWLFGIATNLARQHVRSEVRRYRALSRVPALHAVDDDPGDRLHAHALRGRIADALAGLKPRDRDALLLLAWADLTYAEIAAVQDVPVGTVRSRINRARRITSDALAIDFVEEIA